MSEELYGGIEAGGTKFVCAVGTGPDDLRDEVRFPTSDPGETLGQTVDYFKEMNGKRGPISALGIATFGPLDPDPDSPTFGHITSTPKPGWKNVDFAGKLKRELGVPVGFDTDVNVAALGEQRWGAAQGLDTFIYLTIGTGLGGGGLMAGNLMHGLIHPEMGHMRLPHDWESDPFPGICPFHGDCLEGLTSGPAIEERWKKSAKDLSEGHPAWELEAHYLALALNNLICAISPRKIILGGGVMEQKHLFPMIRQKVQEFLNQYVQHSDILQDIENYIVPPGLGNRSGVLGAIALAEKTLQQNEKKG